MRIRLNNLKGSYVSKDKFQAYRKQNNSQNKKMENKDSSKCSNWDNRVHLD